MPIGYNVCNESKSIIGCHGAFCESSVVSKDVSSRYYSM